MAAAEYRYIFFTMMEEVEVRNVNYGYAVLIGVAISGAAGAGHAAERVANFTEWDVPGQQAGNIVVPGMHPMANQQTWIVNSGDLNAFRESHSFWVYKTGEVDSKISAGLAEKQREIDELKGMVRNMAAKEDAMSKRIEELENK
jgi:hypothetical protein